MVPFGVQVRQLREARRWSQRDLAARARLSLATIQTVEAGLRTPRRPTVKRLASVFGIDPGSFASALPVAPMSDVRLNIEDLQIAVAYNRAPTDIRIKVNHLLRGCSGASLKPVDVLTEALRQLDTASPAERGPLREIVLAALSPEPPADDAAATRGRGAARPTDTAAAQRRR
jgi:transcriptional regulator with XRE-family HTH domain